MSGEQAAFAKALLNPQVNTSSFHFFRVFLLVFSRLFAHLFAYFCVFSRFSACLFAYFCVFSRFSTSFRLLDAPIDRFRTLNYFHHHHASSALGQVPGTHFLYLSLSPAVFIFTYPSIFSFS